MTDLGSLHPERDHETVDRLIVTLDDAERQAWEALARYKFLIFGYRAAQWVLVNQLLGRPRPNPWKGLVAAAREHLKPEEGKRHE